jgi:hypothetical protein
MLTYHLLIVITMSKWYVGKDHPNIFFRNKTIFIEIIPIKYNLYLGKFCIHLKSEFHFGFKIAHKNLREVLNKRGFANIFIFDVTEHFEKPISNDPWQLAVFTKRNLVK